MDVLNVGNNVPIKLKVSVQTQAIPVSYGFLYNTEADENPYSSIAPFDPIQNPGWKSLDKGNPVGGKVFRVLTFFRFFNTIPNEQAFNLTIEQIEDSYKAEIKGGNQSPYKMNNSVESFFSSKTCIVESEVQFI